MPLRDHFHSPVNDEHDWSGLFGGWPASLVRTLFDALPDGYRAGPRVFFGSPFEPDIIVGNTNGGAAVPQPGPSPTFTVEADLASEDEYEVRVYDAGQRLVAASELVSPANKDRPDTRERFVGKVAALLRQDVCVTIVDIVTARHANLYSELLARLGRADPALGETPPMLYAVTLRGRKPPKKQSLLDAWFFPLTVGQPLPTVPLWLGPDLRIDLPLEPGYQETCRLLRIA